MAMLFAGSAAFAESSTSAQLATLTVELRELDASMRLIRNQLNERSQHISAWHGRREHAANPYSEYRLQALLKQAQGLSAKLQKLESRRQGLMADFTRLNQRLSQENELAIEQTAQQLAKKGLPAAEKSLLSRRLAQLLAARQQSQANQAVVGAPSVATGIDSSAAAQDLEARAAFLEDSQDRLNKQLTQVRERVAQVKRQQLVLQEARHLMDEEAFFAETSFAKNTPTSSPGALPAGTEANAKLQNNTAEAQTESNNGLTAGGSQGNEATGANLNTVSAPENGNTVGAAESELAAPIVEAPLAVEPQVDNLAAVEPVRRLQPNGMGLNLNADGLSPNQLLKQLRLAEKELQRELEQVNAQLAQARSLIPAVKEIK